MKVNAIDDGGIRSRNHGGEIDDFVALFEAKKRLHREARHSEKCRCWLISEAYGFLYFSTSFCLLLPLI